MRRVWILAAVLAAGLTGCGSGSAEPGPCRIVDEWGVQYSGKGSPITDDQLRELQGRLVYAADSTAAVDEAAALVADADGRLSTAMAAARLGLACREAGLID